MEIKNGLSCNPPTTGQSTKNATESLPTLGGNSQAENTLKNHIFSDVITNDLSKSGLTVEDAKELGWYEVTDANTLEKITKKDFGACQWMLSNYYVLAFPYPGCDFARVRLYPKTEVAEKTMKERKWKYLQPKDTPPKPYILPQIAELKEKPHKPIIITEGEKKAVCLIKNGFNAVGLAGVWQFKKQGEFLLPDWQWKNRTVYICFDNDVIHNENVLQAEIELGLRLYLKGAKVKVIRLPIGDEKGVDDFIVAKGKDNFNKLIEQSKPIFESYTNYEYREVLNRIRHLIDNGLMTYGELDDIINKFAKGMKIKKPAFEKDLNIEKETEKNNTIIEDVEPYNEPVDGVELVNEIRDVFKRYAYIPGSYHLILALYVIFTYFIDAFIVAPRLFITSPTKRCGKTTLLGILSKLVYRGIPTSNISPSAMFRVIEKYNPTLLIDEADTGLADNDDIRNIVNAGHSKDEYTIRTGDRAQGFEPERFDVFGAVVIAMIGTPKDKKGTWLDRSIIVRMERKPVDVRIKRQTKEFKELVQIIKRKLYRWRNDNIENIKSIADEVYNNVREYLAIDNDRQLDNYYPLITIAKHIGITDELIKDIKLFEGVSEDEDDGVQFLQDIKSIFDELLDDKITSKDLCGKLIDIEDRPYSDYRHGQGIAPNILSNRLKPFGIKPTTIRINEKTYKGYTQKDFKKAFSLYLPIYKSNNVTLASKQGKMPISKSNTKEDVTFEKTEKLASEQDCYGVTFKNPKNREIETKKLHRVSV